MIGVLFHGPEVFDSGWGSRIIDVMKALDDVRCVLAGAMGRTAVIDNGLEEIEFWWKMPGACIHDLASQVDAVIIVNYAKSEQAGLVFGAMVVERAKVNIPIIQVECSGPFFVEWVEGCDPHITSVLRQMEIPQRDEILIKPSVWEADGKVYRRMTTAAPGDFILINGIMAGRATRTEIVIVCKDGHIIEIQGADIKEHGIEKLDRFGGVDLQAVKLASTNTLRRMEHTPRTQKTKGCGVVFIDHAGMHVYDLAHEAEGVVTVGDDTTAVVGDILYRFQIPVIGIVDGDADMILQNGHFTSRSVRLTVQEDDLFGLKVFETVFQGKQEIDAGFEQVRNQIIELAEKSEQVCSSETFNNNEWHIHNLTSSPIAEPI
ncbi:MAG: DUF2117 domain-containing protein [Deltaproteobacteria bacterium]|nr:DUF2117 domain-containing protein [Deltaproteobacteria bacterium]